MSQPIPPPRLTYAKQTAYAYLQAFDASLRDPTNANLHDAPAYCGVFRTWQGWLSLSSTGPGEGTLRVFPALREATAYVLLRPFFRAVNTDPLARGYLDADNWVLDLDSATYPGVVLGKTQELNAETHPHLRLKECMVPIPRVEPGDYVFWHCGACVWHQYLAVRCCMTATGSKLTHTEGIHAVEPVHNGTTDSSVLYLAACPLASGRNPQPQSTDFCYCRHRGMPNTYATNASALRRAKAAPAFREETARAPSLDEAPQSA